MGRSSTSPRTPRRGRGLLLLLLAAATTSMVARAEEVALPAWMARAAASAVAQALGGGEGPMDPEAFAAWREGVRSELCERSPESVGDN